MINHFEELNIIIKTKSFKKYGFGKGGDHNDWIKKMEKLSISGNSYIRSKAITLTSLGYSYAISKGIDNDNTKELIKLFNEKII